MRRIVLLTYCYLHRNKIHIHNAEPFVSKDCSKAYYQQLQAIPGKKKNNIEITTHTETEAEAGDFQHKIQEFD